MTKEKYNKALLEIAREVHNLVFGDNRDKTLLRRLRKVLRDLATQQEKHREYMKGLYEQARKKGEDFSVSSENKTQVPDDYEDRAYKYFHLVTKVIPPYPPARTIKYKDRDEDGKEVVVAESIVKSQPLDGHHEIVRSPTELNPKEAKQRNLIGLACIYDNHRVRIGKQDKINDSIVPEQTYRSIWRYISGEAHFYDGKGEFWKTALDSIRPKRKKVTKKRTNNRATAQESQETEYAKLRLQEVLDGLAEFTKDKNIKPLQDIASKVQGELLMNQSCRVPFEKSCQAFHNGYLADDNGDKTATEQLELFDLIIKGGASNKNKQSLARDYVLLAGVHDWMLWREYPHIYALVWPEFLSHVAGLILVALEDEQALFKAAYSCVKNDLEKRGLLKQASRKTSEETSDSKSELQIIDEIIEDLKALKKAKKDYRAYIDAYERARGYVPDDNEKHKMWIKHVQPILDEIPDLKQSRFFTNVKNYGTDKFSIKTIKDMIFGGELNYTDEEHEAAYMDALIEEVETVRRKLQAKLDKTTKKGDKPDYVFKFEGATWRIKYTKEEVTIRACRGMHYINFLLKHPEKNIECLEIEKACVLKVISKRSVISESEAMEQGLNIADENLAKFDDFDKPTIEKSKQKLEEDLQSEGNPSEKVEIRDNIKMIDKYLSYTFNKFGHKRSKGNIERCRARVSKAISIAKKNIADTNPTIGKHFQRTINGKDTRFVYDPDPEEIDWVTS